MKDNSKKLKKLAKWFNLLNDDKQKYIFVSSIADKKSLGLNEKDLENFKELRNTIIDIISEDSDEDKTIEKLLFAGLEENAAKKLFSYCNSIAIPLMDSQVIRKMSLDHVAKATNFVVKNILEYKQYYLYPFKQYVELGGFINSSEANKSLRFLYEQIYDVANRTINPDLLKNRLMNEFELSEETTSVIIDNVKDNLIEIQQGVLFSMIKDITERLDEISLYFNESKKEEKEG